MAKLEILQADYKTLSRTVILLVETQGRFFMTRFYQLIGTISKISAFPSSRIRLTFLLASSILA